METIDQDKTTDDVKTLPASDDANTRLLNIVKLIIHKDETALTQLYDMTSRYVYGLALKICIDTGMAEEVTSDVYVQVWQSASNYDPLRAKVLTWMLVLCRSKAIDALRRQEKLVICSGNVPDEPADYHEPPEILQNLEKESEMYRAISQLDPELRQLLSLAFFRGFSHQQISDYTRLPLGTVKTHIRNAMTKLKNSIK